MNKSARNTNNKILQADLCYKIQGAIYEVANKYGQGLKERIYQKALAEELEKIDLKFEQQKRINIYSLDSGKVLGTYIPDFVIEDKVVVEIKASSFTTKIDVDQQRSYLRTSIYEIGYLVNFSTPRLYMRRSIYTNDRKQFIALLTRNS
ncbi:GxxExxY protein [Patescibacteria group bacterium]|nr:GxxExxY protein [Patescibacteria group bacterium]MBU4512064.1 GxxExxY protein [Patescibacteria group bacterium]